MINFSFNNSALVEDISSFNIIKSLRRKNEPMKITKIAEKINEALKGNIIKKFSTSDPNAGQRYEF